MFYYRHYMVCGFGRIGHIVANALAEKHARFVVIDNNEEALKEIEEAGYLGVLGDATLDEVLLNAEVKDARCLIATLTNDAENVFVTLTARQLNSQLCIVARAQEPEAEPKLKRAGANKVVLPYRIGALQIAQTALRPNVIDLVEIATGTASSLEYQIEELKVTSGSRLANKTLMELGLSRSLGIIVIGIRRTSEMLFNPSGDAKIHIDDILIALGSPDQLKKLEEMVT